MHANSESHPQVLLITLAALPERCDSLCKAILHEQGEITAVRPESSLPDPGQFDAIIIDGPQTGLHASDIERLVRYVQAGGFVLAINAAPETPEGLLSQSLLGCHSLPRLQLGEFFVRTAPAGHELLRRIPDEFALLDSFAPLQPLDGHTTTLINARLRFHDQPVIIEHVLGKGRVVVSALGGTREGLETPALRTLFRRSLLTRNGKQAEKALGVGIVGYGPLGGVGYAHGVAVAHTPGLRLVAACDRAADRLEAARADFPDLKAYAEAEELARDPEVDIAIVATPPSAHVDLIRLMLRAGKHVVSEKPLCLTVKDADSLYEDAVAGGLVLTVSQNRRWDADFLAIKRTINTGMLGEVFNIETFVGSFAHPCREWHSETAISGGTEYDWGSHHIDWILQLMGSPPQQVSAIAQKRVWHDVSNHDQIRIRMLWEDGREAEFMHSDLAAIRKPKFYLQGTQGTLSGHYRPLVSESIEPGRGYVRLESHHAEAPAELILKRYEFATGHLSEQTLPLVVPEPYPFHRNLADHLHSDGTPLAVSYQSVRNVIAVLEAAHESAEHGGVTLAPPL